MLLEVEAADVELDPLLRGVAGEQGVDLSQRELELDSL